MQCSQVPFNSQGTVFIHPPFIFLFIKQNYGFNYWISLFVSDQLCLPQPKQGQKHEEGNQVPLEFCHISVTKRNDHWRRTWLNHEKICLLGNAEHRLPKYVVNDWPFFTDECTKKYAAIWLPLCMKCDPIAAYHWRMILCPGLISKYCSTRENIYFLFLDLLCILFQPGSSAEEVRIHLLKAFRRNPLGTSEEQHTRLM